MKRSVMTDKPNESQNLSADWQNRGGKDLSQNNLYNFFFDLSVFGLMV